MGVVRDRRVVAEQELSPGLERPADARVPQAFRYRKQRS